MQSAGDVLELERVAYELWRAPEVEERDGWRLRFAHGVTGRANSVWPNGASALPLDEKIAHAETWYRERGLAPRFQITAAAEPPAPDDAWVRLWAGTRGFERLDVALAILPASPGETAFARVGSVARELYARVGFAPSHEYRYLVAP